MTDPQQITDLLQAWARGEQSAAEKLMPLVMGELRLIARHYMKRERSGHTLQTTALINEAYVKLAGQTNVRWQNRSHFYAIAACCMRRVLTDYAKTRQRDKRGGAEQQRVEFSDASLMGARQSEELITLDAALKKLAEKDERKSKVVELRYFGGYSIEEIAEMLEVSETTIARDWRLARTWLRREVGGDNGN